MSWKAGLSRWSQVVWILCASVYAQEFEQRLSEKVYNERAAKYSAQLPAPDSKEVRLLTGVKLTRIQEDSPAEQLRLRNGDIIVAMDKQPISDPLHLITLEATARSISVIHGPGHLDEGKQIEYSMTAGALGITVRPWWNVLRDYRQNGSSDPRWDDAMRVALLSQWDDLELSETALAKARAAGYPKDRLFWQVSAQLLYSKAEFDAALSAAQAAFEADPKSPLPSILWLRSAMAILDTKSSLTALERFPSLFSAGFKARVERWAEQIAKVNRQPLQEIVSAYIKEDAMLLGTEVFGRRQSLAEGLFKEGRCGLRAFSSQYEFIQFGPVGTRFECSFEVSPSVTDPNPSRFMKCLETFFDTADREDPIGSRMNVLNGFIEFLHPEELYGRRQPYMGLGRQHPLRYRMLLCNGMCEIYVNEQRLFIAPFEALQNTKYYFRLKVVGVTAPIRNFKAFNLLTEAEAKAQLGLKYKQGESRHAETPLHRAVYHNDAAQTERWLKLCTDPSVTNSNGETALHTAGYYGLKEQASLLLQHGYKHDLYTAAGCNDIEAVKAVLKAQPESVNKIFGTNTRYSALQLAISNSALESVRMLLAAGADPNAREGSYPQNGSALHLAVMRGNAEIVEALLDAGADPGVTDGQNHTPEARAKQAKQTRIQELLAKATKARKP